jgi:glucose-1-phosphate thymidylyltransferase
MNRKGVLLVGGRGTRLDSLTKDSNKHFLFISGRPMFHYPLDTMYQAKVKEVLVISTPEDLPTFRKDLQGSNPWEFSFSFLEQSQPRGIADGLILAEGFLDGSSSILLLGDNLFFGNSMVRLLAQAHQQTKGATIFVSHVSEPSEFGIAELSASQKVISLQEKPINPRSNWAVTGLYFFDERASAWARGIRPSARGELEITDLNLQYLTENQLHCQMLPESVDWVDAGTPDSLTIAQGFAQDYEQI